eukprot:TRINITY_DN1798_c0_g2_i4.p1 TRINITY_DN1798_c0_g2~~TRINITY_DN1798_c0_g2_i4.p1  ORF type:complete len:398 (+),score=56.72 TRINITY_DN1798_c0_g2_i4:623-1816(+)
MERMLPVRIVNAFTHDPSGGNPAGVCVLDAPLEDSVMQEVAKHVNLSETAFVVPVGGEDVGRFSLRWFTPTTEVPLCGHGTLATSHALFESGTATVERLVFNTLSGDLIVTRCGDDSGDSGDGGGEGGGSGDGSGDGSSSGAHGGSGGSAGRSKYRMEFPLGEPVVVTFPSELVQVRGSWIVDRVPRVLLACSLARSQRDGEPPSPRPHPVPWPPQRILDGFGLPHDCEGAVVQTSFCQKTKKLLVAVDSLALILRAVVHCDRLLAIDFPDSCPVRGVALTTSNKLATTTLPSLSDPQPARCYSKYDFVSRYFSPWNGIPEDPVTGSAHTCLAAYWSRKLGKDDLLAFQASARGGEVRVVVVREDGDEGRERIATRVILEGSAVTCETRSVACAVAM